MRQVRKIAVGKQRMQNAGKYATRSEEDRRTIRVMHSSMNGIELRLAVQLHTRAADEVISIHASSYPAIWPVVRPPPIPSVADSTHHDQNHEAKPS